MIDLTDIHVTLGPSPILHGITARFPAGKVTALVGPNGAGKSTLLAAAGRLVRPSRGEVRLHGRPLAAYKPEDLARRMAVLRQDGGITARLNVRDLVTFGRYPHCRGRPGPADRAAVDRALRRLDLAGFAERFLDTLSGGQRQRALIAMALVQAEEALLLDEPLNNLDLAHARRVMAVAREEAATGKAVAVVLHDLTIAAAYADHVIALKDGRLHAEGPVADVLSAAGLGALYETEVEVAHIDGRRIILPI
ncbi:ATP-binding cassette domain-containing protein [Pseudoroseicyclus tamaricis]|uniref:ATP-binding cassette domain-containing protein n=1 Tax=Pseudoroseicyclus tamaricis TaxID=2705421 RepID=A0A6B2JSW0_9RHOB|nr:ATP-binding cassette domain-containing protein [Pseudoroseicyclus tamaricis]NDV01318.1 ATP-binding cassette domain-containing protein [Pseudoroseicyclus tamaricis]